MHVRQPERPAHDALAVNTLVSRFSLVSIELRKAWVELNRGYMFLKGSSHVR